VAAPVRISGVRMVTTTDFRNKLAGGTILFMHSRRARRALIPFLILNMEPLSRKVLGHCAPNSRGAYVACEAIRTYSERSLVDGVDGWNTGNGVLIPYRLTARFSKSRYDDACCILRRLNLCFDGADRYLVARPIVTDVIRAAASVRPSTKQSSDMAVEGEVLRPNAF